MCDLLNDDIFYFQCNVLVLRAGEHGQVPAEDAGDDHHGAAADADDRGLRHQRVGAQLHGHHRHAHQLPHQPDQHQALHGHVLLVLRPLRTVLLQSLPLPQNWQEGQDRTHPRRARHQESQLQQCEQWLPATEERRRRALVAVTL